MKQNKSTSRFSTSFSGVFRLTGRIVEFDKNGAPYIKLRLSHCDADYVAGLDVDKMSMPENIGYLDQVTVSGEKCSKNALGLNIKLHEINLAL